MASGMAQPVRPCSQTKVNCDTGTEHRTGDNRRSEPVSEIYVAIDK